ncbi:NAD(P)/FAD-dependent oxidoreductase [Sunxiuqinia sp. A32]|uniref:NAD(P)/FAD-dependent oxidoreductase n=1 Tax=Sunxiuqinia sp. A32 TaxID=3461496 RepID=UPI0040462A17
MKMEVDFIISGQGLAGTLLAWELANRGKTFIIFDDPNQAKASEVAAGLVNPVVFRRMTKSWLIDELYPILIDTYTRLENQFKTQFFYPLAIKKILGEGEADFWKSKTVENQLHEYIRVGIDFFPHAFIRSPHGIGEVVKSGRVNLSKLIAKLKQEFKTKSQLRSEKIDYQKLVLENEKVSYNGIKARKIIFCDGHRESENPFFTQLNFRHTKGEVLRIKPKSYRSNFILNKAMFLMPEGDGIYRLGATYNWKDTSEKISKQARIELQRKLAAIFTDEYTIIDHQTGIRPTSHDRRPIVGIHPQHEQLGIFNGLGSKGTMLAPYFARQLADNLCHGTPIHPKADINRYY